MPDAARRPRKSGSATIAFSPADRDRWQLDRSVDAPDTRGRRHPRTLAAAPAEAARATAGLPSRLPSTAVLRDAVAATPARTLPGLAAEGSAYDAALAVGRTRLLVTQNFSVAILDKDTGTVVSSTRLVDWFPSRPPGRRSSSTLVRSTTSSLPPRSCPCGSSGCPG